MDNLNPPRVLIESNVVGLNESVRLDSLFSVTDADENSSITEYQIRDNTPGGGFFTQNGVPLDPTSGFFHVVRGSQIGTIQYVGGDSIGTDSISILAYDGSFWSDQAIGSITSGNSRPVLSVNDVTLLAGTTISIADLIEYSDAENDPDRLYYIVDRKIGANGGQLINSQDEAANPQGNWLLVNSFELEGTTYEAPTVVGDSERLSVRVFDGFSWSEVVDFRVTASAETTIIDTTAQEVGVNERALVSELFSLNSSSIQSYLFVDRRPNADGGYFELNGVRQASADWFSVSASELDQLSYVGASVGNDLENIGIITYNGFEFSDVQEIEVLTGETPFVSISDQAVRAGFYLNFATGGSANTSGTLPQTGTPVLDFTNDGSIKEFLFVDRLIDGGNFFFKGASVPSAVWFSVPFNELDQLEYRGASSGPTSEDIGVMVNTDFVWSDLGDFTIDTIPVVLSLDTIERIAVNNLFSTASETSASTRYQIFDENLDTRSGRLELDGVDLEIGVVHELTVGEYNRLVFKGAEVDLGRQLDPVIVRSSPTGINSWSEWERVNFNTDPVAGDSLITGTRLNDDDVPDPSIGISQLSSETKNVITYAFTDGGNQGGNGGNQRTQVPDYYAPNSDEAIADLNNIEKALSRDQREAFREVFAFYEDTLNVEFVELPYTSITTNAEIVIGSFDFTPFGVNASAYAYLPGTGDSVGNIGSDIWFNTANGDFDPDQDGMQTDADGNLIPATDVSLGSFFRYTAYHELGHSLGLDHPFEATTPLSIFNNFDYLTVMAYQHDSVHNRFDPYVDANGEADYPASLALYDLLELQNLYGANTDFNSGNNQYGNFYSGDPHFVDNNDQHQSALWDGGGNDTLNYTLHTADETMDLREGTWSSINGFQQSLRIAYSVTIENARGGSGNDNIRGNEIKNFLIGNDGDDVIRGGGDNDVVRGGAGDDTYIWSLGDGRDLVQELSGDGLDTLEVYDPSGRLDSLEDDLTFRRFGNDLRIDFTFDRGAGQGTVTIDDFGDQTSRVEFLTLHNESGTQIGNTIDLQSIYDQATTLAQQFSVTNDLATTLQFNAGDPDPNAFAALAVS